MVEIYIIYMYQFFTIVKDTAEDKAWNAIIMFLAQVGRLHNKTQTVIGCVE